MKIALLVRYSHTPSTTIPSPSILTRVSPIVRRSYLHVCTPSPWRLAKWLFSFLWASLSDKPRPPAINKASKVSRSMGFVFSCDLDDVFHTHMTESLTAGALTEIFQASSAPLLNQHILFPSQPTYFPAFVNGHVSRSYVIPSNMVVLKRQGKFSNLRLEIVAYSLPGLCRSSYRILPKLTLSTRKLNLSMLTLCIPLFSPHSSSGPFPELLQYLVRFMSIIRD